MKHFKQIIVNEVESKPPPFKSFLSIPNILDYFKVIPGTQDNTEGSLIRKCRTLNRHYSNYSDCMTLPERECSITINKDGYCSVSFTVDGKSFYFLLHRIIAEVYIPVENCCYLEVNHKDGNKQNNQLYNLEWVTHKQNIIHASEKGLLDTKAIRHVESGIIYPSISKCELSLNIPTGRLHEQFRSKLHMMYENNHFEIVDNDIESRRLAVRATNISNQKAKVHSVRDEYDGTLYSSMVECDKHLQVYIGRTQYCLLNGLEVIPQHLCRLQIPEDVYALRSESYSKYKLIDIV